MTNDIDALDALFWPSEFTVRIGPGQNLYGIAAIQAFRTARVGGSPPRSLLKTVITSFGTDFATANAEFQRVGAPAPGRQTQSGVRFPEALRVVSSAARRGGKEGLSNGSARCSRNHKTKKQEKK